MDSKNGPQCLPKTDDEGVDAKASFIPSPIGQTKLDSFIESCANVLVGYVVAVASQMVVFPAVGIFVPVKTNLVIGFWFTIISLIRSYGIRRYFNKKGKE